MTTGDVQRILDQLADLGSLEITLTGGEPLLRRDFAALYRYAREKGFLVSLFTNATLVNGEMIALLSEFPPLRVDVSVYGATEETYEKITRKPGSYRACMEGLSRLADAGIALSLKTVLMRWNLHEFGDLERLAASFNARFRHDTALFPRLDGDRTPIGFRVSPEEAVERDLSGDTRKAQWFRLCERAASRERTDRLYFCGAGRSGCHINAYGRMQPCLMTAAMGHDARSLGVAEAWRKVQGSVRGKNAERQSACRRCERRHLCLNCPGYALMEVGDEAGIVPYLCATARLRHERLNDAERNREREHEISIR
jgi:radical SAM protein with 4Fe4S-binding SPASM domain